MGTELNDQAATVAQAFVQARREARSLATYPGNAPTDLDGAYAIQDRAIALDGRTIIGWKVGRINPPHEARLGANRLSGPIFADDVVDAATGDAPDMPVFVGGFAAAEAEILLHVAPGFSGPVPITDAETIAILDDVRFGIEVAGSPYPRINADGPTVTISDFGNNAGLVRGASLPDWREVDLCAIVVRTSIDGAVIGQGTSATMLDGPYGAVRFLLANLIARGFDVSSGLWVSSGAITGIHEVSVGQSVIAEFGDLGKVRCGIVGAKPR